MTKYLPVVFVILGLTFSIGVAAGTDPGQSPPRPPFTGTPGEAENVSDEPGADELPETLRYPTNGHKQAPAASIFFGQPERQTSAAPKRQVAQGNMVWKVETADNERDVGPYPSMAFDSNGYLTAAYYDADKGNLKHIYRDLDGSGWHPSTADDAAEDVGQYASMAYDSSAWPHVVYYGVDEKALWYSYWDGSGWQRELVDGNNAGKYAAIALDGDDHAHVSYYDEGNHDLKYAYRRGKNDWRVETVHGGSDWVGWYSSLALDSGDRPHIAYYDASSGDLLYTYFDGSGWQFESVDYQGTVGVECSLAIDSNGVSHVSYWDWGANEDLKYAFRDSSGWHSETVDSQGSVGRYSSLAVDPWGYPHISYHDWGNEDLKYAFWTGSNWHIETAATHGAVGIDTSITLDDDGYPYIAFYDGSQGALKVAIGRISTALDEVPQELYRRANQHLQDMRNNAVAPQWAAAKLGSNVKPLYRPDVEGIAYYEFPVRTADDNPAGFILLSADEHDYGVPHWSPTGDPLTELLDRQAQENNETAAIYFKLDALSYAAQNSAGDLVASLNNLPPKISGFDAAWLSEPGHEREATWAPDQPITDDSSAAGTSGTLTVSGDDPPPEMVVEPWASWAQLKNGYVDSYEAHLDALHDDAEEEWDSERTINQNGRVLYKGDVYDMVLLYEHGTAHFDGAGVDHIKYEAMPRAGLPPLIRITVLSAPSAAQPLAVRINYDNGKKEIVNFYIAAGERRPRGLVYLPVILGKETAAAVSQAGDSKPVTLTRATQNPFIPQWWFAAPNRGDFFAAEADQRWYSQMKPGQWPNTSGCASGCGPTAWTMLFGWADYRASIGDPIWAHRWGIYRQGGYGGLNADAVAPPTMYSSEPQSTGIKRAMWEIRGYVDTFCVLGQGATAPWNMDKAAKYLQGRTGARLTSGGSVVGNSQDKYRDTAVYTIRGRGAPAVVSTGWFAYGHYPVAFGYSWHVREKCHWYGICTLEDDYQFVVNQGGGRGWTASNQWYTGWEVVKAETWYVGLIWPQ